MRIRQGVQRSVPTEFVPATRQSPDHLDGRFPRECEREPEVGIVVTAGVGQASGDNLDTVAQRDGGEGPAVHTGELIHSAVPPSGTRQRQLGNSSRRSSVIPARRSRRTWPRRSANWAARGRRRAARAWSSTALPRSATALSRANRSMIPTGARTQSIRRPPQTDLASPPTVSVSMPPIPYAPIGGGAPPTGSAR